VPDAAKLKQLEPFVSRRLAGLLRGALAYRERWIAEHPPEPGPSGGPPVISKPPFSDGALFSSLFEGPHRFTVGDVSEVGDTYRVNLELRYEPPGAKALVWTDVAIVVKENDRYVVDDVELLGDWPFGSHGLVSKMLHLPKHRGVEQGDAAVEP
jgi:hypothetical protein